MQISSSSGQPLLIEITTAPPAPPPCTGTRSFYVDPGGRVIARTRLTAHLTVDAAFSQPMLKCWGEEKMIDAQPGIALPTPPLVVPESVHRLVGMKRAQRVGPTLVKQLAIGGAGFRLDQRVVLP